MFGHMEAESTYQSFLDKVEKNPLDFMTWENILRFSEGETYENYSAAYEKFLDIYPYCYAYWQRYAERTQKEGKSPIEIYEKAISRIPYCVDIWKYYLDFTNSTSPDFQSQIPLYEKALSYTSLNRQSSSIWSDYIQGLDKLNLVQEKYEIYKKIFSIPHPCLMIFWDDYIKTNPDQSSDIYIELYDLYQSNLSLQSDLVEFESNIDRKYFHMTPVTQDDLQNWRYYLCKITEENDQNETKKLSNELIIQLFETSIITCCNYTEFWERYIDYLITFADKESAKNICDFALSMYLKYSPHFLMWMGSINEVYQFYDEDFYSKAYDLQKPSLEIMMKYINYLLRQNQIVKILEVAKTQIEGTYYNLPDKEYIVEYLGQLAITNSELHSGVFGLYSYLLSKSNSIVTNALTYCSLALPDQLHILWDELTSDQKQKYGQFYLNLLDSIGNISLLVSTRKEIYNLNNRPVLKRPKDPMGNINTYPNPNQQPQHIQMYQPM